MWCVSVACAVVCDAADEQQPQLNNLPYSAQLPKMMPPLGQHQVQMRSAQGDSAQSSLIRHPSLCSSGKSDVMLIPGEPSCSLYFIDSPTGQ